MRKCIDEIIYPVFIVGGYLITHLLINIINIYSISSYFINTPLNFSIYYLIISVTIVLGLIYNFKVEFCPYDCLIISAVIFVYTVVEYKYGIILLPINIVTTLTIYSIGILISGMISIFINRYKHKIPSVGPKPNTE